MPPDNARLCRPTVEWETAYRLFLDALIEAGENGHLGEVLNRCGSFTAFLDWLDRCQIHIESPDYRSMRIYWLIVDDAVVGESQITRRRDGRYTVGYIVSPRHRRCGYGHVLLQLTLAEARTMGIESIYLSCRPTNTASIRIIEQQGGRRIDTGTGPLWHYRIDL